MQINVHLLSPALYVTSIDGMEKATSRWFRAALRIELGCSAHCGVIEVTVVTCLQVWHA